VTLSLYRARWFLDRAGLDDTFFSDLGQNHDLIDFIEEFQLEFDADTRAAIDGEFIEPNVVDQVNLICDYLEANQ
jgi:hypothetical protein